VVDFPQGSSVAFAYKAGVSLPELEHEFSSRIDLYSSNGKVTAVPDAEVERQRR
jgi:hypothetical protein